MATNEAPKPKPTRTTGISSIGGLVTPPSGLLIWNMKAIIRYMTEIPNIARATLMIAEKAPPLKHI